MQGMSLCSSEGNKLIEKIDKALETSRIMSVSVTWTAIQVLRMERKRQNESQNEWKNWESR